MLASMSTTVGPSPARMSVKSERARSRRERVAVGGVEVVANIGQCPCGCLPLDASNVPKPCKPVAVLPSGEVPQGDPLARAKQVGDDLVVLADLPRRAAGDQERPQTLANLRRQHLFEILERRAPQLPVVAVQAAEGDLQRIPRQDQR